MVNRILGLGLLVMLGCREPLQDDLSVIEGPRILAVQSEPAEAEPGDPVHYTVLYVDQNGERAASEIAWAYCLARKPLDELGPFSKECLRTRSPDLIALGSGAQVDAALPDDGCKLFGPDPPDPVNGQPAGRPVDPDSTGGYEQPLQVRAQQADLGATTLATTRILCGLDGATPEVSADFKERYLPNANPTVEDIVIPAQVTAGSTVELEVEWPSCGDEACGGAESYVWFDPSTRALQVRREGIRASWFATAGRFDIPHTGRAEGEDETFATNLWKAPDEPGEVTVYVVLRDDRGGVGWGKVEVGVER